MVKRAAVLIGVGNVEGLPTLLSAAPNARTVAHILDPGYRNSTAFGELFEGEKYDIRVLTDDLAPNNKVTSNHVIEAIDSFVTLPPTYHELVVFFSGHGLSVKQDIWLLSGAKTRTSEAINVMGSMAIGFYSGIANITLISDACRSLPKSRSQGFASGLEIFPTYDEITDVSVVDTFRAARAGTDAYEIPDIDAEDSNVRISVMTYALREAFQSPTPEMVTSVTTTGDTFRVVTNRTLKDYLPDLAAKVLAKVNVTKEVQIIPSVPSNDSFFMATVREPNRDSIFYQSGPVGVPPLEEVEGDAHGEVCGSRRRPDILNDATEEKKYGLSDEISQAVKPSILSIILRAVLGTVLRSDKNISGLKKPSTQLFYEILSDRKSQIYLPDNYSPFFSGEICSPRGLQRVYDLSSEQSLGERYFSVRLTSGKYRKPKHTERTKSNSPLSCFFVQLETGEGIFLPHLEKYLSLLIFDESELGARVTLFPRRLTKDPENFRRFLNSADHLEEETEYDLIAKQIQNNELIVDSSSAAKSLANKVRIRKGTDPTLGLYASYAYQAAGMLGDIVSVNTFLRRDNISLFDTEMLARRRFTDVSDLKQPCPLLTQGWHLLNSRGIELSPVLQKASAGICDSLWTMFDEQATNLIVDAIERGEDLRPRVTPSREHSWHPQA